MKTCSVCKVPKPADDFYAWKHVRSADGLMARCKQCHRQRLSELAGKTCDNCGGPVSHKVTKLCQACRTLSKRGTGSTWWQGGRSVTKDGYIRLSGYHDHPNARRGKIAEHVLVMSEILGRALYPDESVHHKNTIRDDNTPSNLELWSGGQPSGGRVEDKLAWACQFISRYHPEWLTEEARAVNMVEE